MFKNLNVRIKLIAEDNVILVKCPGFRTEIFMPAIVGKRLSIINVVPQRRCRCLTTSLILAKQMDALNETTNQTISEWCLTADFDAIDNLNQNEIVLASTPEQMRGCARQQTRRSLNFENAKHTKENYIPPAAKVIQSGSENLQPVIASDLENNLSIRRLNNEDTAENIPLGSLSHMEFPENPCSAEMPGLSENTFTNLNVKQPPRWRKVITPLRTYARRKFTPHKLSTFIKNEIKPNYLENPTAGVKGEKDVFNIKLKNVKTRISPRTFRAQFQYKSAEELRFHFREELRNRESKINDKTVFELLTTPAFSAYSSDTLKKQFMERCTYKFSSTYSKYQKLASFDKNQSFTY